MTHDPIAERYLSTFRAQLKGIDPGERDDLVREIESHIAEAAGRGVPAADVLERLGPADKLARAYRAEVLLNDTRRTNWLGRMFALAGLLLTASIPSMVIIPTLGGIGIGFVAGGLAAVVASLLPFVDVSVSSGIPGSVERLIGVLIGMALLAGGFAALTLLYWYMRLLVAAFKRVTRI